MYSKQILSATTCLVVAAGLSLLLAGRAEAVPMKLTLTVTNDATHVTDSVTSVSLGNSDSIDVPSTTINGVTFSGEFDQADLAATDNSLITSAFGVTNYNNADVTITSVLSAADFPGPDDEVYVSGSGTWLNTTGSVMNLAFYDDPGNVLGASSATDTPGQIVGSFTSAPAGNSNSPTSSYSYSPGVTPFAVPDISLFSMTEVASYTLLADGQLTGRTQAETKIRDSVPVPEPGSLLLLGTGMIGVGLARRRRNKGPKAMAA